MKLKLTDVINRFLKWLWPKSPHYINFSWQSSQLKMHFFYFHFKIHPSCVWLRDMCALVSSFFIFIIITPASPSSVESPEAGMNPDRCGFRRFASWELKGAGLVVGWGWGFTFLLWLTLACFVLPGSWGNTVWPVRLYDVNKVGFSGRNADAQAI